MHKRSLCVGLLLITMTLLSLPVVANAEEPVARFFVFEAQDCAHCQTVKEEVLIPLSSDQYGDQVEIRFFDIGALENYEVMVRLEGEYGISGLAAIPLVFIGDQVLVGEEEIRDRLPGLVEQYLAAGGCEFPSDDLPADAPTLPSEPDAAPVCEDPSNPGEAGVCEVIGGELAAPVYIAYFYSSGCRECDRVSYDLAHLEERYPNLQVRSFDINDCAPLNDAMSERSGVPPEERLLTPALFVGGEYLAGDDLNIERLEETIRRHSQEGCIPPWEGLDTESPQAVNRIIQRFKSLSVLGVLGAGLLDGVNPCAFATIIFFVSYMTVMERRGKDILFVGGAFTLGVFLTYLLVGIGLLGVVHSLSVVEALSRLIYVGTGIFCLVLAGVSVYDVTKIRQGNIEDIALKLPQRLRRRAHKAIREGATIRNYVWAAFVSGLLVSLLELACTGQAYLPTIVFVTGVPGLRVHAIAYLILYNLMFVAPLVIIFVLVFYGTNSLQLAGFLRRNAALVKLFTAVLFAALGTWLLVAMI